MKKYTITEQEWENVISKVRELENESNKLKGYIEALEKQLTLTVVVDSEPQLCGKSNCNRQKLDGNVYCSYHYEINFG